MKTVILVKLYDSPYLEAWVPSTYAARRNGRWTVTMCKAPSTRGVRCQLVQREIYWVKCVTQFSEIESRVCRVILYNVDSEANGRLQTGPNPFLFTIRQSRSSLM